MTRVSDLLDLDLRLTWFGGQLLEIDDGLGQALGDVVAGGVQLRDLADGVDSEVAVGLELAAAPPDAAERVDEAREDGVACGSMSPLSIRDPGWQCGYDGAWAGRATPGDVIGSLCWNECTAGPTVASKANLRVE